jgi:hypothetical protein
VKRGEIECFVVDNKVRSWPPLYLYLYIACSLDGCGGSTPENIKTLIIIREVTSVWAGKRETQPECNFGERLDPPTQKTESSRL